MSKYATFTGRASRSECWWFFLFSLLLAWGAQIAGASTGGAAEGEFMYLLVTLALLVPQIAVGARRLHDTGKSGWRQLWILTIVGLIPLIVWWATEGPQEENEYGPAVTKS